MLLIDAERGIKGDAEAILERLKDVRQPKVLILNKVDRVKHEALLKLSARRQRGCRFESTFMVSALTGSGCKDVLDYLAKKPAGRSLVLSGRPDLRPADAPARGRNHPRKALSQAAPGTALFLACRDGEVGREAQDGSVRIDQVIYVERDSQKKIVLGHKGETIRAIGQSRMEIAGILEQKVHLFLFVKVRENWGDDPERYREMGLDFP
jgi:GTP-binding protein Era